MKQVRILSSAFFLFLLWWLLAVWMDNDFIIPYPLDVFRLMIAQLQSITFYQSTLVTFMGRACGSFYSCGRLCLSIVSGSYLSRSVLSCSSAYPQCSQHFLYHCYSFMVWFGKQCCHCQLSDHLSNDLQQLIQWFTAYG